MKKQTKGKAGKAGKGAKKAGATSGRFTSLHILDPAVMDRVKAAAAVKKESVSKFMLAAADRAALVVLQGDCPTCGTPMKKTKTRAKTEDHQAA